MDFSKNCKSSDWWANDSPSTPTSTSTPTSSDRIRFANFSKVITKVGGLTILLSWGTNCSGTRDLASSPKICSRSRYPYIKHLSHNYCRFNSIQPTW